MVPFRHRLIYNALRKELSKNSIKITDRILVVCGGDFDRTVLMDLNFENVTISNLDTRMKGDEFHPYAWSFQDAEDIKFDNDTFDWVIVHAGLHHCYSPHRALLEMLRVGKLGAIVIESRESFTMKLAIKLGLTDNYEIQAVIGNHLKYGGVANTFVPNFVYRWTEKEVIKLVCCQYPQFADNKVDFHYGLRIPYGRIEFEKSNLKRLILHLAFLPLKLYAFLFPKQSNEFGFVIRKGATLQQWLEVENGKLKLNMEYLEANYDTTVRK